MATALGTLVLALATFAAVRSGQRAARATERALLASIRPVLVQSRLEDPSEKVGFRDEHWVKVPAGHGVIEVTDEAIYLAIALRNVGTGLAVLDRFLIRFDRTADHPDQNFDHYQRLTRDLYVPAGDHAFWQGALRDPADPMFARVQEAVENEQPVVVDLLYSDHDGGQRTITRFSLTPRESGQRVAIVSRHWNIDRDDPR